MLQTYSRARLSLADLQFVVTVLCRPGEREATLFKLLADAEIRDTMLEHPRVWEALLDKRRSFAITPFLYFYLLARHALQEFEIDDRLVAEYLANLLVEFGKAGRAFRAHAHAEKEYHYLVDLLNDLLHASREETFYLRSHLGNYALFLTGLFPARIYHRSKYHPPAPDFSYYETMGSNNFRLAAQHVCAEHLQLSATLEILGRKFRRVRLALNHAAENFMHLNRNHASLDNVMRRVDDFVEHRGGEESDEMDWQS